MSHSKVWVVTYGEYSDVHIVAVCSDQVEANRLAGLHRTGLVAEFVLDELAYRPKDGEKCYFVRMDASGNVELCDELYSARLEPAGADYDWIRFNYDTPRFAYRRVLSVRCWASSKEHATKIANEFRIKGLAEETWEARRAAFEERNEEWKRQALGAGREYPYTHEFVYDWSGGQA